MKRYRHSKANTRKLTDEEIAEFKDFGQLRTNYEQALHDVHHKPIHKQKRVFIGLLILLLLLYIIITITEKEEQETPSPAKVEQRSE